MTTQSILTDVPETMLWTLHNRANEAMRADACIQDAKCIEIYQSINYNYEENFGKADVSHGTRSMLFDRVVSDFITLHPDAVIVNLGEGLETQRFRIDTPETLWFSIDVPDAMEIRERYIKPDERHRHIAKSALDTSWFDEIPMNHPIIITAQGLFMYFTEQEMAGFIHALAKRFPGARLMFDYISVSLSQRTLSNKGWQKTAHYRTPPMPWGIDRNKVAPTLSKWIGSEITVHNVVFDPPRGYMHVLIPFAEKYCRSLLNKAPGVCYLDLP